jgi:dipeptidyl aminopeptidase/acylaminoacyl peptidase
MKKSTRQQLFLLLSLAVSIVLQHPTIAFQQDTLKALTPADFGQWEGLGYDGQLSANGAWLVYHIDRNNKENELRLHNLTNEKVRILKNGTDAAFSGDNQWLGYLINVPETERKKLEKDKKPVHTSFGLINLTTGDSVVVKEVAGFDFSDNGQFVVLKRYDSGKGSDIVVRDLAASKDFSFGNVAEHKWQDKGVLLAMAMETAGKEGNGIQLFDGKSNTVKLLHSAPAYFTGLAWREKSADLAVYQSVTDEAYEDSTHLILEWKNLGSSSPSSLTFDPKTLPNFPTNTRIVSHESLRWNKDGSSVFFETMAWVKKPAKKEEGTEATPDPEKEALFEEAPALEIWNSNDVNIIPEQKQLAERKRERSYLAAWHLADSKFVQLGDDLTEETLWQKDVSVVLGLDETPYEFDGMFGRSNADVYTIDIQTGKKQKILEQVNHLYDVSSDGKTVVYLKDDNYHAFNFQSGKSINLTGNLPASFVDAEDDHPVEQKPPYRFIGWDAAGTTVFVHSKYDIWSLNADGSKSTNLTNGAQDKTISRYASVDDDNDYIDLKQPMYIHQTGEWSKKEGYAVLNQNKLKSLHWDDVRASRLIKAKEAATITYVLESFEDSPDYYVSKDGSSKGVQVSATNPFQKDYRWGKAELIEYTNANGVKLQGSLFYPDDYEPGKTYPMITYVYELLSQNIHRYIAPSQWHYYNHRVWTSQGYFVLQPDILFDAGDPGISSTKTIEIAVKTVVDKGLVDPKKVGMVGHSWGGYQAAFAATNTNIFAAIVAGAGLTDLVSMYGMVAWSFGGTPENYHFEVSQERMMVPPWKNIDGYVRNSPVMNIDKMTTPLLFEVGDADTNVDWRQGIEMYNAARRADKEMVLLVYAKEGHGLREDKNRYDYQNRILQWFGHYLKGEPAKDWIKQGLPYTEQQRQLEQWKK